MNRAPFLALAAAALAAGCPAQAAPLTFGGINSADDLSQSAGLACPADREGQCALTRTTFGGLPINDSRIALTPEGRARSLAITLDDGDYDLAYQLLVGRYGPPASTTPSPRWTGFDDGATLGIRRSGSDTLITFDFPVNALASPPSATPDASLIWSLLGFASIGVAVGMLLYLFNRTRPALASPPEPAPAQPSMRATLERRLSEGRDLEF